MSFLVLATCARAQDGVTEVTVRAARTSERMERSAASVTVVDLTRARRQSADLGELLARTQGVSVRRSGGLGSGDRLSLNGLEGERIRIFVDGLPIAASAYNNGVANIPLNLIERVEIYRGVVPIRFGTDALGGAINIVTRAPTRGQGGGASLQLGSFSTTRASADGHLYDPERGLLARANVFVDSTRNDYPVQVTTANAQGQQQQVEAYRKHDGYRMAGGGLDLGVLRRTWAERLMLRTFASGYDKELQSNLVMTQPYGEARYGGQSYGATLQYVQPLHERVRLDVMLGYGHTRTDLTDRARSIYDWFGRPIRMSRNGGEINPTSGPIDQLTLQHGMFGRANVAVSLAEGHTLHASVAPSLSLRTGENRLLAADAYDALSAQHSLLTLISGLEHAALLFDERLENSLFAKSYLMHSDASEPLNSGARREVDQRLHRLGFGDGLRVSVTDWLYAKVAYELATRLPSTDELFGDGRRIRASYALRPEHSHNTNLTLALRELPTPVGAFTLQATFFDRRARNLIAPPFVSGDSSMGGFATYRNVGSARSTGFELVGGWSSPGDYLTLGGNVTWQDFRNTSRSGDSAAFRGDRIPHLPWLFANASARGALPSVLTDGDELSLSYFLRYVHGFFRGWESAGQGLYGSAKDRVDAQLSHSLGLTYLVRKGLRSLALSLDAHNLTDQALFDEFGAQRPGRAYYMKLTAEL